MTAPIPAFKGFNSDLTCLGFQFKEGETFEQDAPAKLCTTGFHAVTSPLEVFGYYAPGTSVYHEVTLEDVDGKRESDSKIAGRKITIGAAIGIPGVVKAHIKFVMDNVSKDAPKGAVLTGDRSAASNTGDRSAASNTGYQSAASNTGDRSAASNTGDRSAASNTGYLSAASNTGYQSAASVTGKDSIAIVTGKDSKASGALGCWIVLTERDDKWAIVSVKAVKVDGSKVKADTFYMLRAGKVVTA